MNTEILMEQNKINQQYAIQDLIGSSNKILQVYASVIRNNNQKLNDEMKSLILDNMNTLDNMIQTGFFMENSMNEEKIEELNIKNNFISVFTDTVEQNSILVNYLIKK